MNILYLSSCFDIGGTEFYTLDYAKCMLSLGHNVSWGTAKDGKMRKTATDSGIKIFNCSLEKRNPLYMLKSIKKLKKLVKNSNVEIIHATDAYSAMIAMLAFKRKKDRPKIVWSNVGIGTKAYAKILKICGDNFDLIIAVSNFIRNRMIEEGFDPKNIKVYSQSRKMVDATSARESIRESFSLKETDVVIGNVGRIVTLKGNQTLIEAMPKILEKQPTALLMLVGDGPQRKELEELCAKLGVSNRVNFTGFRTDIENVYSAFDLVAFPTYYESLGYIPFEAMYYKKPIVASLTGGVPEIVIDGYNGLLVPPAETDKWVDAILKLITDKELCEKFVLNGTDFYEKYLNNKDDSRFIEKLYKSCFKETI